MLSVTLIRGTSKFQRDMITYETTSRIGRQSTTVTSINGHHQTTQLSSKATP